MINEPSDFDARPFQRGVEKLRPTHFLRDGEEARKIPPASDEQLTPLRPIDLEEDVLLAEAKAVVASIDHDADNLLPNRLKPHVVTERSAPRYWTEYLRLAHPEYLMTITPDQLQYTLDMLEKYPQINWERRLALLEGETSGWKGLLFPSQPRHGRSRETLFVKKAMQICAAPAHTLIVTVTHAGWIGAKGWGPNLQKRTFQLPLLALVKQLQEITEDDAAIDIDAAKQSVIQSGAFGALLQQASRLLGDVASEQTMHVWAEPFYLNPTDPAASELTSDQITPAKIRLLLLSQFYRALKNAGVEIINRD